MKFQQPFSKVLQALFHIGILVAIMMSDSQVTEQYYQLNEHKRKKVLSEESSTSHTS